MHMRCAIKSSSICIIDAVRVSFLDVCFVSLCIVIPLIIYISYDSGVTYLCIFLKIGMQKKDL